MLSELDEPSSCPLICAICWISVFADLYVVADALLGLGADLLNAGRHRIEILRERLRGADTALWADDEPGLVASDCSAVVKLL